MTISIAPLSAGDVAAIESLTKDFPNRLVRREFDALVALYTEDAVFMPPHHPAVHGRAAVKTWMAALPELTDFALTVDRVDGRADLAYVRGTYTMSLRPEGTRAPVTDIGKYIEIRRRQPNGT